MNKKICLFGLYIDRVLIGDALEFAYHSLEHKKQAVIFTPNLEILSACRRDKELKKLINSASLSIPDGIGISIVSKLLGKEKITPVAGIDFAFSLLSLASCYGKKVFLLGGKEEVAKKASQRLKKHYPSLNICGYCNGYGELKTAAEKIKASSADIVFVCLGFPKQEKWVAENRTSMPDVSLFLCLGGSLDVWSGNVRRAPDIIQKIRLEWLWRVVNQPSRIPRLIRSTDVLFSALYCKLNNNLA